MCGIVGIFNLDNEIIHERILHDMCKKIEHRGPDEKGKNLSLGMQRLSIMRNGSQPIHNKNKSVWTVYNGEIYNFKDLRKNLIKKIMIYHKYDTEVIVHLYDEYGESFVKLLNGMFSIALWDDEKETLFLYRDRMGEKPLHYY